MINYILLALLIALQIGDFYTTYTIIKTGKGYEANPFVAKCIDELGLEVGLGFTKVAVIIVGVCVAQFWNGFYVLVPAIALYSWVVFNNYKIMVK